MATTAAIVVLVSYLIGSIPFGYIAGRIVGIDVRQHGSGNIGATNVLRVLGKQWGIPVFILDALKGFVAVQLALFFAGRSADAAPYADFFGILAAAICVAGHSFPVWLKFDGGKGVATSAGALVALVPIATLTIFLVWLVVFFSTRYVSLASVCAALALPIAVAALIYLGRIEGAVLLSFSIAMTALVVWRHRSNLARLLAGTEPRVARK
jgi:acyl phosphate:glycerol-3-phosphate acyltransferase